MAGARVRRAIRAAVAVSLLGGLTAAPPPARADEHGPGSEPFVLPGSTWTAVPVDVDGDGTDEVARIVGDGPRTHVEVWKGRSDGTWSPLARADTSGAHVNDGSPASPPPIGLIIARHGGRDRVITVSASFDPLAEEWSGLCCVSFAELRLPAAGGEGTATADDAELRPMPAVVPYGEQVLAADLDGDGSDELVVTGMRHSSTGTDSEGFVTVLRRDDASWTTIHELSAPGSGYGVLVGDTDGRSGLELLVSTPDTGAIERMIFGADGVTVERGSVARDESGGATLSEVAAGRIVLTTIRGLELREWPAGGVPRAVAAADMAGWPWGVPLGDGPDAPFIVQRQGGSFGVTPRIEIRDASLRFVDAVEMDATTERLGALVSRSMPSGYDLQRSLWPRASRVPGGWVDGRPAYIAGGTLLLADGRGGVEHVAIRPLVGEPIAVVGPGEASLMVCDGCSGEPRRAWLVFGEPWGTGRLSFVAVAAIEAGHSTTDAATLSLVDAVAIGTRDGMPVALVNPEGGSVLVDAPPGTIVVSSDGRSMRDHGEVSGPIHVRLRPSGGRADDENPETELIVVLIGIDGTVRVETVAGTFAAATPELAARAALDGFGMDASVAGRASPGSVVTVDGATVSLSSHGAFRATVEASIWPRQVLVVARDPWGAETVVPLEVVGPIDYRGWPWIPIVAGVTLALGVVLFLRTPARRATTRPEHDGDATLEELDGDVVQL